MDVFIRSSLVMKIVFMTFFSFSFAKIQIATVVTMASILFPLELHKRLHSMNVSTIPGGVTQASVYAFFFPLY